MTIIRKQQTTGSYNKNVYCVYQFACVLYFFYHCSFNHFETIILQEIWEYIDLNGDVTRWQMIMSRLYFSFSCETHRVTLMVY